MSEVAPTFAYRVVGADGLEAIRPLWAKLRAYHTPWLARFTGETPPFDFEPRKLEILAKAAVGKLRVELVSTGADPADIGYCVSTVSADVRGELDSMFVEERFRGRGLGGELIRRSLAWQASMGASSKVVSVAHANEAALALYRRFGFHPRTILLQQ
ncbi:MAG: N-acetyltransferase, partial [Proteobacteria bacterium]|nr:N-acetyltransferase [Pseudomonadota bacterium]